MEGGTGFEPVNGDFADHSVSLFATRPYFMSKILRPNAEPIIPNFDSAWQATQKRYPG